MKKKISLLLAAVMLLTGCNSTQPETTNQTTEAATTTTAETTAITTSATTVATTTSATTTTEEEQPDPAEELPRMDGSTSATPLEAGLKAELLGISYNEAKELVYHTKTHESFERLLNGKVDLIFSVPISEEQQKMADEAGVTLNAVPVAKEGFVFVVNADNPVDTLTTQQIKDIYSGKITNWAEVGGKDMPILAYQRNTDSGSQNYMTQFMGDTALKDPESKYVAVGMGGLMDAIATYDNSEGAIGYSVYSYAAQMYANANKVKFIAVDGVEPTKATMADDSYSLSSCTYIIYPDTADEKTMNFVNWAVSDEGQNAVLKSGYLPVNGMEIPDSYLPYDAVGTGEAKPADYMPDREFNTKTPRYKDGIKLSGYLHNQVNYYKITFLADKDLQDRINADIREATDSLRPYYDDKYLVGRSSDDPNELTGGVSIMAECFNGYLSILLYYESKDIKNNDPIFYNYSQSYDYAVSLNYDLFTGEKIEKLSDLFYEGADFVPAMNNAISDFISINYVPSTEIKQKIDFSGLLGEPEVFTISRIWLPQDNAYFYDSPYLVYTGDQSIYDLMVVGKYRDMSEIFVREDDAYDMKYTEWEEDYIIEDGLYIPYVKSSRYHTEEEIKERNELYYKAYKAAAKVFKDEYKHDFSANTWNLRLRMHKRVGAYWLTSGFVEADLAAWLDAETLEPLSISDILGENWIEHASSEVKNASAHSLSGYTIPVDYNEDPPVQKDYLSAWIMYKVDEEWGWGIQNVDIPLSEVNMKYIGDNTDY
ncbi:MAG: substrate-binding domain-containing protein [Ruminiclostridium sp.]|nr:substrate-binding domain-containing protein [Ruminiclostridium sp.]